jgi:hypothetical protein
MIYVMLEPTQEQHIRVAFFLNIKVMKKLIPTLISLLAFLPMVTFAHEGHGVVEQGPAHFVFSFEHALPLIALVAIVVYLVRKRMMKRT